MTDHHPNQHRDPKAAVTDYHERRAWPARQPRPIAWMQPGATATALHLPYELTARVLTHLDLFGVCMPAIGIPTPPARMEHGARDFGVARLSLICPALNASDAVTAAGPRLSMPATDIAWETA